MMARTFKHSALTGVSIEVAFGCHFGLSDADVCLAQYGDSAREQSGLGKKPFTGLGRNTGRALPLMTTDNQNLAIKADREMRSKLGKPVVVKAPPGGTTEQGLATVSRGTLGTRSAARAPPNRRATYRTI